MWINKVFCLGVPVFFLIWTLCQGQVAHPGYSKVVPENPLVIPEGDQSGSFGTNANKITGPNQNKKDDKDHHHHHQHHDHGASGHYDPKDDGTGWDIRKSIPGEPNVDYPALESIPKTAFTCLSKHPGYYADLETKCQVFRICTTNSINAFQSFLCPNGSIFNQELLTCDWWNNVDCASSESYHHKNKEMGQIPTGPMLMLEVNKMLNINGYQVKEEDNQIQETDSKNAYLPPIETTTRKYYTPTVPTTTYKPEQSVPIGDRGYLPPKNGGTVPKTEKVDYLPPYDTTKQIGTYPKPPSTSAYIPPAVTTPIPPAVTTVTPPTPTPVYIPAKPIIPNVPSIKVTEVHHAVQEQVHQELPQIHTAHVTPQIFVTDTTPIQPQRPFVSKKVLHTNPPIVTTVTTEHSVQTTPQTPVTINIPTATPQQFFISKEAQRPVVPAIVHTTQVTSEAPFTTDIQSARPLQNNVIHTSPPLVQITSQAPFTSDVQTARPPQQVFLSKEVQNQVIHTSPPVVTSQAPFTSDVQTARPPQQVFLSKEVQNQVIHTSPPVVQVTSRPTFTTSNVQTARPPQQVFVSKGIGNQIFQTSPPLVQVTSQRPFTSNVQTSRPHHQVFVSKAIENQIFHTSPPLVQVTSQTPGGIQATRPQVPVTDSPLFLSQVPNQILHTSAPQVPFTSQVQTSGPTKVSLTFPTERPVPNLSVITSPPLIRNPTVTSTPDPTTDLDLRFGDKKQQKIYNEAIAHLELLNKYGVRVEDGVEQTQKTGSVQQVEQNVQSQIPQDLLIQIQQQNLARLNNEQAYRNFQNAQSNGNFVQNAQRVAGGNIANTRVQNTQGAGVITGNVVQNAQNFRGMVANNFGAAPVSNLQNAGRVGSVTAQNINFDQGIHPGLISNINQAFSYPGEGVVTSIEVGNVNDGFGGLNNQQISFERAIGQGNQFGFGINGLDGFTGVQQQQLNIGAQLFEQGQLINGGRVTNTVSSVPVFDGRINAGNQILNVRGGGVLRAQQGQVQVGGVENGNIGYRERTSVEILPAIGYKVQDGQSNFGTTINSGVSSLYNGPSSYGVPQSSVQSLPTDGQFKRKV